MIKRISDSEQERKTIDSLKGIAILGIVLVHSDVQEGGLFNCIVASGARGVQLMFLINGYLIFKSLDNARERGETLKQWYKGKILRILPLYWFFTVLHLVVFGTGTRYWIGPLEKVSWLNIICNLLCIHGFFPYYINSINLNWFIANIAIWYFIAPLCYKLFNSLEKIVACLLTFPSVIYILLIWSRGHSLISNEVIWKDYVDILCFLAEFPVILLGCMIFYLIKEERIIHMHTWMNYACLFFSVICLAFLCIGSNRFSFFTNVFSYGICFLFLFLSQVLCPVILLSNSFLATLGKYSFGIYLCHMFVIYVVSAALGGDLEKMEWGGQIIKYVLICTISLLVSIGVENTYKWILQKTERT